MGARCLFVVSDLRPSPSAPFPAGAAPFAPRSEPFVCWGVSLGGGGEEGEEKRGVRCDRDISLQGKIRFLWPSVPPPVTERCSLPGSGLAALRGARLVLLRGGGPRGAGGCKACLASPRPVLKDGGGDVG